MRLWSSVMGAVTDLGCGLGAACPSARLQERTSRKNTATDFMAENHLTTEDTKDAEADGGRVRFLYNRGFCVEAQSSRRVGGTGGDWNHRRQRAVLDAGP